jgi:hypothetical protein
MFVLVKHGFLIKKPDCAISWSAPTIALWSEDQLLACDNQHLVKGGWYIDLPPNVIPEDEKEMFKRIDSSIFAGIMGIPTKVVTNEVLAAQSRLKKVVEDQVKPARKGLKSTIGTKHIKEGKGDENKDSGTSKTRNPTGSMKGKKRKHKDSNKDSDDDDVEEIKPQHYHHAKKKKVSVVTPTSTLKTSQRPYKLIPSDFEDVVFDCMNGNQSIDSKAEYVRIAQDFLKKEINDKYDLTIVQIPDEWLVPECPD